MHAVVVATQTCTRKHRPIDLLRLDLVAEYKKKGNKCKFFTKEAWDMVPESYAKLPAERKDVYRA